MVSSVLKKVLFGLLFLFLSPAAVSGSVEPGLLWKIEGRGQNTSYLLGTIHSEDARVLDYSEQLLSALSASPVFAMELVPNLPTLMELTQLMHYQDSTRLEQVTGAKLFAKISARLAAYGIPASMVSNMKPWAAAMTLSVPPPETGMFMDFSLSLRAAGQGARVTALETLQEQVGFLEGMDLEDQLFLLRQAVDEADQMDQQYEQMLDAYLSRDLNRLQEAANQQMATTSKRLADYFQTVGIDQRNEQMLERLLPLLKDGGVFVAIGALHLPGDKGLIRLLRRSGYQLSAIH